jgi:twitching motility two-component system response regulator PilH
MESTMTRRKTTILVVEDDESTALMTKMWLEVYLNLTVIVACDGRRALFLARQEMPDMILMDYMLPLLNGIEATRQLKSDEATRHIPVVLYSNRLHDAGWEQEAKAAGCVCCVDKLMSLDEVETLIESVLSERAAEGSAVEEALVDTSPQLLEPAACPLGAGPARTLPDEA